jgi:hypothetical protein
MSKRTRTRGQRKASKEAHSIEIAYQKLLSGLRRTQRDSRREYRKGLLDIRDQALSATGEEVVYSGAFYALPGGGYVALDTSWDRSGRSGVFLTGTGFRAGDPFDLSPFDLARIRVIGFVDCSIDEDLIKEWAERLSAWQEKDRFGEDEAVGPWAHCSVYPGHGCHNPGGPCPEGTDPVSQGCAYHRG